MATAAEAGACFCPLQVRLLQSVLASHWLDLHILTLYEQHPYFPQADNGLFLLTLSSTVLSSASSCVISQSVITWQAVLAKVLLW